MVPWTVSEIRNGPFLTISVTSPLRASVFLGKNDFIQLGRNTAAETTPPVKISRIVRGRRRRNIDFEVGRAEFIRRSLVEGVVPETVWSYLHRTHIAVQIQP